MCDISAPDDKSLMLTVYPCVDIVIIHMSWLSCSMIWFIFPPGYGTHTLATHISVIKKKEFDDILAGTAGYLRGSVVNTSSDTPSSAAAAHRSD